MNRSKDFKLFQEKAVLETSVKVGLSPAEIFFLLASINAL